ncbi:hypothetical protein ES703_119203 [subsurface metagenome]
MTEGQVPEPKSTVFKGKTVFTVCGCKGKVVTGPDGKKHLELDCIDKEAREEIASILEEEAILRVNPKVVFEETPEIPPTVKPYVAEPSEEATHEAIQAKLGKE